MLPLLFLPPNLAHLIYTRLNDSILASNRDEYLDRPALPADYHTFAPLFPSPTPSTPRSPHGAASAREPWVISGRDTGSPVGGTWLGMTKDLRLAVL